MAWEVHILKEARKNFTDIGKEMQEQILAGIYKVSHAPLPRPDGYGKQLGNKHGNNLTGFFKIKYKGIGIRVVYTLVLDSKIMNIVAITKRDDNYCYELAAKMYKKYGDEIFADSFDEM